MLDIHQLPLVAEVPKTGSFRYRDCGFPFSEGDSFQIVRMITHTNAMQALSSRSVAIRFGYFNFISPLAGTILSNLTGEFNDSYGSWQWDPTEYYVLMWMRDNITTSGSGSCAYFIRSTGTTRNTGSGFTNFANYLVWEEIVLGASAVTVSYVNLPITLAIYKK